MDAKANAKTGSRRASSETFVGWCENKVWCVECERSRMDPIRYVLALLCFEKQVESFRRQGNRFVADTMVAAIVWCMVEKIMAGNT